MSVVITMPPPSSTFLPFGRTVIVMTTCSVSKPFTAFRWPVFSTLKSISYCTSPCSGSSLASAACSFIFFCASSHSLRISAKVFTL